MNKAEVYRLLDVMKGQQASDLRSPDDESLFTISRSS